MGARPFLVGGGERSTSSARSVLNPFDGSLVAEVARPGPRDLEDAIAAAVRGFESLRRVPAWKRSEALLEMSRLVAAERERLARTICLEAGKPIRLAREKERGQSPFRPLPKRRAVRKKGDSPLLDAMEDYTEPRPLVLSPS